MRLGWNRFIALAGVLAATTLPPISTLGITIRNDEPESNYLALAQEPQYAAVGSFVNGTLPLNGSGTLIAPDWVLTAAHLTVGGSSGTFTIDGNAYTADALYSNPGWNGNAFDGYDFGLVHLSTPVPGITPATLYMGSADLGTNGPFLTGTYVGYGFGGTGTNGWQTAAGAEKRACENVIDGNVGNPSLVLCSDFDDPNNPGVSIFGSSTPLTLEGCVAPGDSGGGVFITIDNQTYLEGVISFVSGTSLNGGNGNSVYGDVSGSGRVSAVIPWIDGITGVPEPPASVLLAAAGLVTVLAGRRFRPIR